MIKVRGQYMSAFASRSLVIMASRAVPEILTSVSYFQEKGHQVPSRLDNVIAGILRQSGRKSRVRDSRKLQHRIRTRTRTGGSNLL